MFQLFLNTLFISSDKKLKVYSQRLYFDPLLDVFITNWDYFCVKRRYHCTIGPFAHLIYKNSFISNEISLPQYAYWIIFISPVFRNLDFPFSNKVHSFVFDADQTIGASFLDQALSFIFSVARH